MTWSVVFMVLGALLALSLISPTWRRIWVFNLTVMKYALVWLADKLRLRWLWAKIVRKRYEPFTGPVAMRTFCEDMGPTFIKFGQIVASSAGIFPERYVQEFRKCLDRVRPFPFSAVQAIVRDELGDAHAEALSKFDPVPLASASIAQVHTAELPDGSRVVVKVQRPNIHARTAADMRIMRMLARVAARVIPDAELANPVAVVEDFASTLREELDFRLEAKNLERFNQIVRELGYDNIRAPVPHWTYISERVLVMERFFGTQVDRADEIHARDIDAEATLVTGLRAWFQCVIFYGFFHGDVHAGNLMLLDNEDIGFIDFGIVGRFTDEQRWLVTDYIIAFASGDFDKLGQVIADMDSVPDNLDMDRFVADLRETYAPIRERAFGELNYAEFLPSIQRVSSRHRMTMPKEFVLITKQMLYFDRYAKLLAPKLNIFTDPRLIISLMGDIQKARAAFQAKAS